MQDASSAPQREWIESSRNVGIGKPDVDQFLEKKHQEKASQRYPVGHPLAWLQGDEDQKPLPEERRKEIVSLGFPDDGYDYLQHVRQGHAEALVKAGESQNESEEGGESLQAHIHSVKSQKWTLYADNDGHCTVMMIICHKKDSEIALFCVSLGPLVRELGLTRHQVKQEFYRLV